MHTENDTECDEAVFLLSPHLWDLGLYFSRAPEKAVEVFVHFKPPAAPVEDKEEESTAAGHQSPIKTRAASPKDEHQHHQQWSQEELDAAEALLALSRDSRPQPLPAPLPSPQPQNSSNKRARNSSNSSSSSGSSPIVHKRRARSAPPARRQPSSSPLSSRLSSPPADDELDAQQHDLDSPVAVVQQDQEEEEKQASAPSTVTLHLRYHNRMTRSHGATVPDLVLRGVPAAQRLADLEDAVKNHACEAFLLLTATTTTTSSGGRRQKQKLSQRQALELVDCLAVRVLVDGDEGGGGDALRERRGVGEYAVVEEGQEEGQEEKVVRGTVEMWREEHIAMEVLRRESPTGNDEEE